METLSENHMEILNFLIENKFKTRLYSPFGQNQDEISIITYLCITGKLNILKFYLDIKTNEKFILLDNLINTEITVVHL
jgi:hypothetical protein